MYSNMHRLNASSSVPDATARDTYTRETEWSVTQHMSLYAAQKEQIVTCIQIGIA